MYMYEYIYIYICKYTGCLSTLMLLTPLAEVAP